MPGFCDKQGWVTQARHCPSPNFNARPDIQDISLLVIHSISLPPGNYGNHFVDDFFCNKLDCSLHPYFQEIKDLKVSSHFLINRLGEITQYVSVYDRAWHAGASSFDGRENCNDYSIGIEMEGLEGCPFEEVQYKALGRLCRALQQQFPDISRHRICGHSDVSPGRKIDPGSGFNWEYFFSCLDDEQAHLSSN